MTTNAWERFGDEIRDVVGPRIIDRQEVILWRGLSAERWLPMCIYALYDDARPDVIRYVGQTRQSLRDRLHGHTQDGNRRVGHGRRKRLWINSVTAEGRRVQCRPLAFTLWISDADAIERRLIRVARELFGTDVVVNSTDGADRTNRGMTWKLSAETRARQSAAARARPPKSAEHRARLGAALLGRKLSPEHRAKVVAGGRAALAAIHERRKRGSS